MSTRLYDGSVTLPTVFQESIVEGNLGDRLLLVKRVQMMEKDPVGRVSLTRDTRRDGQFSLTFTSKAEVLQAPK